MSEPAQSAPVVSTAPPTTAAEYREHLSAEWGTYVAASQIWVGGALAFNPGDPVPVSNVEGDGALIPAAQVHKITTKAGRSAAGLPEKG